MVSVNWKKLKPRHLEHMPRIHPVEQIYPDVSGKLNWTIVPIKEGYFKKMQELSLFGFVLCIRPSQPSTVLSLLIWLLTKIQPTQDLLAFPLRLHHIFWPISHCQELLLDGFGHCTDPSCNHRSFPVAVIVDFSATIIINSLYAKFVLNWHLRDPEHARGSKALWPCTECKENRSDMLETGLWIWG